MDNTKNIKKSYNLSTPLFLILLVLKLTGIIDWSWWWVTSPLWIPLAIIIAVLGFVALLMLIANKN